MILRNRINDDADKIKLVSFDIDGTITRFKNVPEFLKISLERLDIPYSEESLKGLYAAMKERELHALYSGDASCDTYSSFLGSNIPDLYKYGHTGEDLRKVMFEMEADQTYVSLETYETIKSLHDSGLLLICYTNWFREQAEKKLDKHNLKKFFKKIYTPDMPFIKWGRSGFDYIMYENSQDKGSMIHIGDSLVDISSSYSSGIKSIYLNYDLKSLDNATSDEREIIDMASATVNEFGDIGKVLKRVK